MTSPAAGNEFSLLESYRRRLTASPSTGLAPAIDELLADSETRDGQDTVAESIAAMGLNGLLVARSEAARFVRDDGITYAATGHPRGWVVDPIPLLIGSAEWTRLEHGLAQRADLLDLVLKDLYGERRLLRERVIPPAAVLGHPGFVRQTDRVRIAGGPQLVLWATDLARDADGAWAVYGDRTQAPSGAGYAFANRRIIGRVMTSLHRATPVTRLRGFFHVMANALQTIAPNRDEQPRVVVHTPGPASETAYEQALLSTLLGFPLVEADDLVTRDGRVWLRSGEAGVFEPIDVLLRRVDASWADPLELRSESQLGVPGLIEAMRTGAVSVANPLGAGALENPALMAYLPAAARLLLGEDLEIPSPQGWWCGEESARAYVESHLGQLVIKAQSPKYGPEIIYGWELSAADRDELLGKIARQPWAWVGEEPLPMSTAPVVTRDGLEPRRTVLRTFGVAHEGRRYHLPGGLARVAPNASTLTITNTRGALSKDVWVLSDPEAVPAVARGRSWAASVPAAVAPPAPRVANNLFWLSRYRDRAELVTRILQVTIDLAEDHAGRRGPGAETLRSMVDSLAAITGVRPSEAEPPQSSPLAFTRYALETLTGKGRPGTLHHAVASLVAAAQQVRDQLSLGAWMVLGRLERAIEVDPPDRAESQVQLDDVLTALLAMTGILHESMVHDVTWGYLDAGTRIERAQGLTALVRSTLAVERAPDIDNHLIESVMDTAVSVITFRRRLAAGEAPDPVRAGIALLLLDPTNPRSVRYQLDRLADDMRLIGDDVVATAADALARRVGAYDLDALLERGRDPLADTLATLHRDLRVLADDIDARHFMRRKPLRSLSVDWSVGGAR